MKLPQSCRSSVEGVTLLLVTRTDALRPGAFLLRCCGRVGAARNDCSATELPEHSELRAGLEPATCPSEGITGSAPARSRMSRRGRGMQSGTRIRTAAGPEAFTQITEPLWPATIVLRGKPTRSRTRTCEVGA